MNVTSIITTDYENMSNWAICENEPKTNPNFETTKTNANLFAKKDYEKNRDFGLRQNKAKQTQFHTNLGGQVND